VLKRGKIDKVPDARVPSHKKKETLKNPRRRRKIESDRGKKGGGVWSLKLGPGKKKERVRGKKFQKKEKEDEAKMAKGRIGIEEGLGCGVLQGLLGRDTERVGKQGRSVEARAEGEGSWRDGEKLRGEEKKIPKAD